MLSYLNKNGGFILPTINKRVLSNLIEMIKPYIIENVLTLDKWQKRRGKYDGDGKFTVYDPVEELTVGDRWYAGYDDAVWFTCECDVPVCSSGEKLYFNMNFGGETVIKLNGEIIGSVSSKLHNGWVCRENIPLPKKYEGRHIKIEAESGICCAGFCDDAMAGAKQTYYDTVSSGILKVNKLCEDYYYRVRTLFDSTDFIYDKVIAQRIYNAVDESIHVLKFDFTREEFLSSVQPAFDILNKRLAEMPDYHPGKVIMCGHSHIDVAWLWTVKESERKAVRTFANTLELMDEYPEYKFAQSQAVLYDMVKKNAPEIFERIKEKVKSGQWEVMGNAWVEADTNIASGESLIRQLLYGREFFVREFGVDSDTYWLPDCFGFTWALPQIIKKSGMKNFITAKLHFNDTNEFPYSMFRWRSHSGDDVTAYFTRAPYQGEYDIRQVFEVKDGNRQSAVKDVSFGMFGYGDGGSGSTVEMLERAEALKNIPGVPEVVNSSAREFFDGISEYSDEFPVYDGELYYENHRGTFTSQAFVKKNNRRGEFALRNAEILSSIAEIKYNDKYDGEELERLWKILLVNQFHDILPGSSIHEVYENTRKEYEELNRDLDIFINKKLNVLFSEKAPEAFTAVNYLNVPYTGEVKVKFPDGYNSVEYDGVKIPCVKISDGDNKLISFIAENIPALSGRTYRFSKDEYIFNTCVKADKYTLENDMLKIKFDDNGEMISVFDKENDREVLDGIGNALCIYQDKPIHESAWNLEFDYKMTPYPLKKAVSIEVIRKDGIAGEIKIVRKFNKSTVTQFITLNMNSRQIDFKTQIDWHEREKVLKAHFPVSVRSLYSTSEIAHGSIDRPTHYNTSYDIARFETCMHKWVDLSESGYGVSVLNDCKYGCSVHENDIGITLMRAPICPDPTGDIGYNEFTYSLVPHAGTWQEAGISELSYALNNPPAVVYSSADTDSDKPFIDIKRDGIVLDAFKKAQNADGYILRVFEAYSSRGKCSIEFSDSIESVIECNLMEKNIETVSHSDKSFVFNIKPNEVKTFRIKFK